MSKDQKGLLKRLDALNNNIEILGKIVAVNVGKEVFFKEKKQKEQQIAFLSELGLSRNIIASMVATTPNTVSKTISERKPKQTAQDKVRPQEGSAEKTSEN
jgi:DNA-binding NarL/FixJ family response regulator